MVETICSLVLNEPVAAYFHRF